MVINKGYDLLVDKSPEHHLDDINGFPVCYAVAVDKLWFFAHLFHDCVDLRSSAVDNDCFDPDETHKHDVLSKGVLELLFHHGSPAVLDNKGLSVEFPYVRQGLDKNICFLQDILHDTEIILNFPDLFMFFTALAVYFLMVCTPARKGHLQKAPGYLEISVLIQAGNDIFGRDGSCEVAINGEKMHNISLSEDVIYIIVFFLRYSIIL